MCIMYGNSIKVLFLKIRITNIQKEIYRKSPKVLFSYEVAAITEETKNVEKISCLGHLMKRSFI